jgi:O-acetyl-ADP-ribose deacetylase (regulator of RNase III)
MRDLRSASAKSTMQLWSSPTNHNCHQTSAQATQMTERISIVRTDITTLAVDAIVNAANNTLLGGGGVDGAIHDAAGPGLLKECRQLGGCKTGQAKLTSGYRLPANHIIHTVGPVWNGGDHGERELLERCYASCFAIAREHRFKTLAFPAISCGVYRFPIEAAVEIAMREAMVELIQNDEIEKVIFACFDTEVYAAYRRVYAQQRESGLGI